MMVKLTDDLTINAALVASVELSQHHYMNGPGDAKLIVTMDDGRQHSITHGYGINIYDIKKRIEATA
jgi:hypothetical protein